MLPFTAQAQAIAPDIALPLVNTTGQMQKEVLRADTTVSSMKRQTSQHVAQQAAPHCGPIAVYTMAER